MLLFNDLFTIIDIDALGGRILKPATLQVEVLVLTVFVDDVHDACPIRDVAVALEAVSREVGDGVALILIAIQPLLVHRLELVGAQRADGRVLPCGSRGTEHGTESTPIGIRSVRAYALEVAVLLEAVGKLRRSVGTLYLLKRALEHAQEIC